MDQSHPIEGLMSTAMEQLKNMIDVNTIIGEPIQSADGSTIIPVSKVSFGFAAGGSEFMPQDSSGNTSNNSDSNQDVEEILPFGGGSGGGASITPIAFLIIHKQGQDLIHLHEQTQFYEKLVEVAPQALDKIKEIIDSKRES